MLIAFVLIAAIDAAPPPTVTLVLTGTSGASPVSAEPRSLSDVARELREGRKATASFSAVETTVPRHVAFLSQPYREEPEPEPESGPEVVVEQPQVYVPSYYPYGYGGSLPPRRYRPRASFRASPPAAAPGASARRPTSSASAPQRMTAGLARPFR